MKVIKSNQSIKTNKFSIRHARAALVPTAAVAMLGVFGVLLINQDIDDSASASNTAPISTTVSYEDEYITISSSSAIELGTETVSADASYVYATDNVTVSTNVASGYELYLSSADKSSAALTTPSSYTTIAATSGTGGDSGTPKALDRNSYGYAVPSGLINNANFDSSYANPSSSSKFAGVPASTSDRIHSTSSANESGDTIDVHYGASLTNALAPGTYTGQVIYSAVVTPTSGTYEMSVSPGSGEWYASVVVTSGPTTIATDASLDPSEVQIEFRQNGKTKGTCIPTNVDVSSGHLITTCSAPVVEAGTYDVTVLVPRFGFKDTKTNGFTSTTNATLPNTTMQNFTCNSSITTYSSSNVGATTYSATDSRDGSVYLIRKLADGHCWMVQNLRLIDKTISSSDSDISGTFTIPASSNSYGGSGDGYWCNANDSACDDRHVAYYNNNTTYGAYYNWYTATAGTGTYDKSSGDATSSICPKGWKLPLAAAATYSWYYLYNTSYSKNVSNFQTATNTGSGYRAGYVLSGSLYHAGSAGYWWSRMASDANNVYLLLTDSSLVLPQNYNSKYYGYSVRCVLTS